MTQQEALNILKLGHNVFLTGGAGTGKTFVLNKFIKYLKAYDISHAITASTGIAATHIGGQTIHSFSGLGIKDELSSWDIDIISQNEKLYKRLNNIKVIIIDEISMLKASSLNNINKIFKAVRKNNKPFGGVQIIFCGDFFQLPPVIKNTNSDSFDIRDQKLLQEFAFNSDAWKDSKPVICYLQENFRQEDNILSDILNMIRSKDENIYDSMEALYETAENNLDNPIRLYSHNIDVDNVNNKFYNELEGQEYAFKMKEKGKAKLIENLKKNILALEELKLKINTKVIFIKNDKSGKYQNGTLGIIIGFEEGYPKIELKNGKVLTVKEEVWQSKDDDNKVLAEIEQLPLRYAWAITIHKSQGMTLDEAEIDLSKGFGFGMGYVALSRVRSLSGLRLLGLNSLALSVALPVLEYDKILKQKSKKAKESIKKYLDEELMDMHNSLRKSWGIEGDHKTDDEIEDIIRQIEEKDEGDIKNSFGDKEATQVTTLRLILEGKSITEISETRDLKIDTIISHIDDVKTNIKNKEIDLGDREDDINVAIEYFYNEHIKENYMDKGLEDSYKNLKSKVYIKNIKSSIEKHKKLSPVFNEYKDDIKGLTWETLKIIKIL